MPAEIRSITTNVLMVDLNAESPNEDSKMNFEKMPYLALFKPLRYLQLLTMALFLSGPLSIQGFAQNMPREDVIDVPAIGDGLCVHNLFQSNMVIQRDKPIKIWGWGEADAIVKVTFNGEVQQASVADDRSWAVTFPASPASSEPRQLIISSGDESITLENVLVGDVWVLGGQSNMEFPLTRVENGQLEIVSLNES